MHGAHPVNTFYLISPLKAPLDLDYSEIEFEYLPNAAGSRLQIHH